MAKSANTGKAAAKAQERKSPSFWVLLLCLLPLIALVWFLMHLEARQDSVHSTDSALQRKPAAQPPRPKYEFYKELPKGNANTSPEKKTPAKPAPSSSSTEVARAKTALRGEVPPPRMQYFLQAGSFQSASDAESLRAQLALLGQITHLEQSKINQQTWHRVMIGPFVSNEQLNQTRKQLAAQGYKQLLPQKRQANP